AFERSVNERVGRPSGLSPLSWTGLTSLRPFPLAHILSFVVAASTIGLAESLFTNPSIAPIASSLAIILSFVSGAYVVLQFNRLRRSENESQIAVLSMASHGQFLEPLARDLIE